MSDLPYYLIAGLFLPLFPLSMAFNALLEHSANAALRSVILLAWPQIGLVLVAAGDTPIPAWITHLAVATSVLYAFRAIALREMNQWTAFLATSLWALLWIFRSNHTPFPLAHFHALGMSVPLVLLTYLSAGLTRRFGAAYTHLYGGLAQTTPRLAGILVVAVLATIATPLFPAFFTMTTLVANMVGSSPILALVLLLIWLLWSWAGAQLLQGLIVGSAKEDNVADLSRAATWTHVSVLLILIGGGVYAMGARL
jgi:NADH:ubiquinone oxidoreductase subunit 4 (subunit M)